tara:strand:+ start:637 stop:957 length:321 start_codon:yes stop_codon:yes gene_type:complete
LIGVISPFDNRICVKGLRSIAVIGERVGATRYGIGYWCETHCLGDVGGCFEAIVACDSENLCNAETDKFVFDFYCDCGRSSNNDGAASRAAASESKVGDCGHRGFR